MKRKIIWLEDLNEIINTFEPVFANNDFEVTSTRSVSEALKYINEGETDSLLLDIQIHGNTDEGIIFLKEIKKNNPHLKVVVFSSYLSSEKAMELVHNNLILGHFRKPVTLDLDELNELTSGLHKAFNKKLSSKDMNLKKIKIFLASSDSLNEERNKIEQIVARKNDSLIDNGIYLQLLIWEKESAKFSKGRKQEEFNKLVLDSDIFFCLIFDKVGNFTKEEFDIAHESFKKNNKPSILIVFFKDSPIRTSKITRKIIDVIELKEEIQKYDQFYSQYNSIDNLLNKVNKEINDYLDE